MISCSTIKDPSIRFSVISALDHRFDHFLAHPDNLRCLFIALNDEIFEIRELAISVLGRQTTRNPAYVLPSLRKILIQLLTELEFSSDNRNKEESSRLLSLLVKASHQLVQPYVEPILSSLIAKLNDPNPRVVSYVLAALGELVEVGASRIAAKRREIFPLIINTLQDQSSSTKREVALRTLGRIVSYTGYVVNPFIDFPNLLDILVNFVKVEQQPSIRKEVLKVFGAIGAIDPYKYSTNQLQLKSSIGKLNASGRGLNNSNLSAQITNTTEYIADSNSAEDSNSDLVPNDISPSSEEYYPTVAIRALLKIFKDQTLSIHHSNVVQAITGVMSRVPLNKISSFLPQVMVPILSVMRSCEAGFRKFIFQQLATLVSSAKQHIREYLNEIFALIHEHWEHSYYVSVLPLIEEISLALKDDFKTYLPDLLPHILSALQSDRSIAVTQKVLHALEVFSSLLEDYLHMVIPSVVKTFEHKENPLLIRLHAIDTIAKLCRKLNFSDYASRIIHPLARTLSETKELAPSGMNALCELVYQLGPDFSIFIPMLRKVIQRQLIHHPRYEELQLKVLSNVAIVREEKTNENSESDSTLNSQDRDLPEGSAKAKEKIQEATLKRAWFSSNKSTKDDWNEWLGKFSVELLRESPSGALRSCSKLAQVYQPLARELFNASFFSCWSDLSEANRTDLIQNLEIAFTSVTPEILQTLLNLFEFIEHQQIEKPQPISIKLLGELATKCRAFAKALKYKETEYRESASTNTVSDLISIYNELQHHESAVGILKHAEQMHGIDLNEGWYEKLQRWKDALVVYERKHQEDPLNSDVTMGSMRCMYALGCWEQLADIGLEVWDVSSLETRKQIAPLFTAAAWNLGKWDNVAELVKVMDEDQIQGCFYRALLDVHNEQFSEASQQIDKCRQLLDTPLTALIAESYNRAYDNIVISQQLSELEEVISYKTHPQRRPAIRETWKKRLLGAKPDVDVWQTMLAIHSLVVSHDEDVDIYLKFASLCRKSERYSIAQKILGLLMRADLSTSLDLPKLKLIQPKIVYSYLKYLWSTNKRNEALKLLRTFVSDRASSASTHADARTTTSLSSKFFQKLGRWQRIIMEKVDPLVVEDILQSFKMATKMDPNWYKAWHDWALTNFMVVEHLSRDKSKKHDNSVELIDYVLEAIHGFFQTIALNTKERGSSLQDTLRLLNLWFNYGSNSKVKKAISEGFSKVSIDTWLQVIPQIIARIHTHSQTVRTMIHDLLVRVGKFHPQALVYSLTVVLKSQSASRRETAQNILNTMRQHSAVAIEQATMVSQELIRIVILWHEQWHGGLEEASRQYYGEKNTQGMFASLNPLHEMTDAPAETEQERQFQNQFGRELKDAQECCKKFLRSKKESDLNHAWEFYYHVFRKINKQVQALTSIELQTTSPRLLNAKNLEIAIPGTYKANQPIVKIKSFVPQLVVMSSKQHPRKLTINGDDGRPYHFLLKGHEDLRQDERVMQVFSLCNNLLANDTYTSQRHLFITTYAVCPLSPNSGLIGWVPQHDTLHSLIRDYRESRKMVLNMEHRIMLQMSSDLDNLALIQKVEVFEHVLERTLGVDLDRILWLKSTNSEMWLDKRTNFTRSLAVMSMVGYILGLGDRHPSNIMLSRHTGTILHIDFGDCFEVAMYREKFPEKIPFRLTRMMINAMEVCGIEGNFRFTCENVLRVMRDHKNSLMAILEAFVYDPLFTWRLVSDSMQNADDDGLENPPRVAFENEKAVELVNRVQAKLTGRDFDKTKTLAVPDQVQKLIAQATSNENLCQCYIGWCAFW